MRIRHKVLLFDLDGTLTDPREGITRCVQFALARQHIEITDLARLECFIGPPLKDSFMRFYDMDEARAWRAVNDYRERFARAGMLENRLYEGMVDLLASLKAGGRQLFVATSKPWFFARQIVRHFRLDGFFSHVYGSELDGQRAEKHALIAHIMREEKLRTADVLMIGDRKFDLVGAHHNGIASAAVGYGYGSREELLAERPTYYFESLADMRRELAA